jgi:hypothetical protein
MSFYIISGGGSNTTSSDLSYYGTTTSGVSGLDECKHCKSVANDIRSLSERIAKLETLLTNLNMLLARNIMIPNDRN